MTAGSAGSASANAASSPAYLTAPQARDLLVKRDLTSRALTEAVLERIERLDGQLRAFVTVTADQALAQADAADRTLDAAKGDASATPELLGIPVGLKDLFCTDGVQTTSGSKILLGFVPPYDATVVARLREAGAVLVGKLNMDEFAMGSSTENSGLSELLDGTTRNPWDLERVPGGSSGGSAASVAAGECLLSLGTDTGGSIRQPASLCGVVGMKPTYGRVSRFGVIAFASSLDQVGPFSVGVEGTAMLLRVIAGLDPLDSTTAPVDVPDYRAALAGGVKGLRVGVPKEYFVEGTEPEVERAVRAAIATLEEMGAEVGEVSLPHTDYGLATYYIIAPAEVSSNLARYNGTRYGLSATDVDDMWRAMDETRRRGFGDEVRRRIMLGTYALSSGYYDAYYLKAQKVRTLIKQDFDKAFERFDVLAAPTSPTTAFRVGEKVNDPLAMYLSDVCTLPVNVAGLPGVSVPCGFDSQGLPIGLQLIGKAFDEATLLRAAYAYEQATDWHTKRPAL
ncbi:MAG TPA: Asp-tRNA(Asn)/Glu-tRNA(Gln) amidotransferase subunit GatA [Chloroflexota bacterium]|nr:Asp-tRNA(Asn)/Glu-tRNA(Gln) amidotransferase subunit GatA [Chloroflexota bacterium]